MVRGERSGGILGIIILIIGLGVAWLIWPTGLLVNATFTDLLRMLFAGLVGVATLWVAAAVWFD